ncbi:hypothetical protein ACK3SF_00205 [Candidatus Nanosalina sp. VS9-1]|uniref:hypothetical protein n=1 Tax=Candidatus Nanosalina sp. VS9-1 TaxID=3388566 RepID=UPI0039DF41F7
MILEELEQEFNYGKLDDDEIEDRVQEEIQDLIDDNSRKEIIGDLKGLDESFQDLVVNILDQELLEMYHDQFELDREFQDRFEETLEGLQKDYSKDEIIEMASQYSEEFEEKVREELE